MTLAHLRDQLASSFSESELRNLCFDLNIEYEDLAGKTRKGKARELIAFCQRHNLLEPLLRRCRELRPHINWQFKPAIPSPRIVTFPSRSVDPLSLRNIISGIIVTAVSGIIVALVFPTLTFFAGATSSPDNQADSPSSDLSIAGVTSPPRQSTVTPTITTLEIISSTLQSTPTPTAVTSPTLQAPATPLPVIYNFEACLQPCNGTNATQYLPERTKIVHARWDYQNIPVGSHYVRVWAMDGNEWVRYDCNWPGPESGTSTVALREPDGLHSGTWEVAIAVNGVVLLREELYVAGNWRFWFPVGILHSCFGTVPNQSGVP